MAKRDELERLNVRIGQLEGQLAAFARILAVAEPVLRDANRLTELAEQANRLSQAAETKLGMLAERADVAGIGKPRFPVALSTVYFAETPGYVSMVFYSGRTGAVQVLAGPTDQPTEPVSFPGDQYVGGFIRRGEYWRVEPLQAGGTRPDFEGIFTPLY